MSYAFPKDQESGSEVTLSNGVTYQYSEAKNRWGVKGVEGDISSSLYARRTVTLHSSKEGSGWFNEGNMVGDTDFETNTGMPKYISKFTFKYLYDNYARKVRVRDYGFGNEIMIEMRDTDNGSLLFKGSGVTGYSMGGHTFVIEVGDILSAKDYARPAEGRHYLVSISGLYKTE